MPRAAQSKAAVKEPPQETREQQAERLVRERVRKLENEVRVTVKRLELHARYLTDDQRKATGTFLWGQFRRLEAALTIPERGPQEPTFDFNDPEEGSQNGNE